MKIKTMLLVAAVHVILPMAIVVYIFVDLAWLVYHCLKCELLGDDWEWDTSNGYGRCDGCGMHRPHPGGI